MSAILASARCLTSAAGVEGSRRNESNSLISLRVKPSSLARRMNPNRALHRRHTPDSRTASAAVPPTILAARRTARSPHRRRHAGNQSNRQRFLGRRFTGESPCYAYYRVRTILQSQVYYSPARTGAFKTIENGPPQKGGKRLRLWKRASATVGSPLLQERAFESKRAETRFDPDQRRQSESLL